MPLYMDVHRNIEGLTAEAVAEAHKKDLEVQGEHGVNYIKYSLKRRRPSTVRHTV